MATRIRSSIFKNLLEKVWEGRLGGFLIQRKRRKWRGKGVEDCVPVFEGMAQRDRQIGGRTKMTKNERKSGKQNEVFI